MNQKINKIIDFNIHDIIFIRLIDPSSADERYFTEFLGNYKKSFEAEPDIIIEYVDKIDPGELTLIGLNHAGFNKDGFYILSSGRQPVKVKIPFEKIGERCRIVCERGIRGIPLLNQIINLTFLAKGYIPLHASAFLYNGMGVLVMGWSKGGKTESLLSFALKEAKYIGDETVLITPGGKEMFGIPVSVCLWEWQLKQISELKHLVSGQKKMLFSNVHLLERIFNIGRKTFLKNSYPIKMLGEILPAFKRQLNIRVNPSKVFKNKIRDTITSIDKIILIMSREGDKITVENITASELNQRMIHSQEFELESFNQFYRTFKFAFPEMKNAFLERAGSIQNELLNKAFYNREIYKVMHPYPVSFNRLYEHMQQIFGKLEEVGINSREAVSK